MINRKLALFLAFIMLLGLVPTNVFAANTAKLEPANDKAYEEVIIDGAPYKVYKVADFIDGHSEESTISLMSRSAKPFGSPAPTGTNDIKFVLDLAWETIDRPINNVTMPVYVGDLSDSRSIKLGHFIVNSAASPGAKQRIEMVQEYFGPTPSIENLVKKAFAKIKIAIPEDMKYDFILASTKWEDTQKEGTTGIDLKVVFKIEGKQSVMHGFGIKWYDTDAANREKIDAKWGGLVGQELDAKLATVDRNYSAYFANKIDRTNPGRLQHYPDGSEYTPFDYYYNGEKITTCADAENQGKFDNNQLAIGPNSDRSNAKLTVDGKRHGEKKLKNNTKYFYDSVGDYRTFHVLSMREALKVKFNTGKGKLTADGEVGVQIGKDQEIGHSEKIEGNESGRTITFPDDSKLVPPEKAQGQNTENEFKGWNTDLEATTALTKQQLDALTFTAKETTFYAVFGPKADYYINVKYVKETNEDQEIEDTYKLGGETYPETKSGKTGMAGEEISSEDLDTKNAPKFLGYEITKTVKTVPTPNVGEKAEYTLDGKYTVKFIYKKLADIIPEDEASDDVKKTYAKVTFTNGLTENIHGDLYLDTNKVNGGKVTYYVNPKADKSVEDVKTTAKVNVKVTDVAYEVEADKEWIDNNKVKVDLANRKITKKEDITVNANYKKKGNASVTVEYVDEEGTDISANLKEGQFNTGKALVTSLEGTKDTTVTIKDVKDGIKTGLKEGTEPLFIGYMFKKINEKPEGTDVKYGAQNAKVQVVYTKLDDVIKGKDDNGKDTPDIPDNDPDKKKKEETIKKTYVKVKFLADTADRTSDKPEDKDKNNYRRGKLDTDKNEVFYYVNPKATKTLGEHITDKKITEPRVNAKGGFKVKDPKWNPNLTKAKKSTVTEDLTFVAQYDEKGQGKAAVEYHVGAEDITANIAELKIEGQDYPKNNKLEGKVDTAIDITKITQPELLGYKIVNITTEPDTDAKYTEAGTAKVIFNYEKIDDIVVPKPGDNKPAGYVTVTFLADNQNPARGNFGTDGNKVEYYVNPKTVGIDMTNQKLSGKDKDNNDLNKPFPTLTVTANKVHAKKQAGIQQWDLSGNTLTNNKLSNTKTGITLTAQYEGKPVVVPGEDKPTKPDPDDHTKTIPDDEYVKIEFDKGIGKDLVGTTIYWVLKNSTIKDIKAYEEVPAGKTAKEVVFKIPTASKDGFTWVGWTADKPAGTTVYDTKLSNYNAVINDNVKFTAEYEEKLVRPTNPDDPKPARDEVTVRFLKGEHGTLTGIVLNDAGEEVIAKGKDKLAYNVKKKATWAAMKGYIPTAVADYGWRVANPSWNPILPEDSKLVEKEAKEFTAQYVAKPIDEYITLTLDENYRNGKITDYEVLEGDLIENYLYIPRRRGYVFEGWSYNSRRLDEVRPGDRIEYSTILYAIWSKQKPKDDEDVEPVDTREVGEHKAYMFGYTDGTVRPNGYITRAEAAALVTRLLGLDTFASAAEPAFTDTPSSWYNKAINAAVQRGIMKGYPDKSFRPNAPITRAEFTQMISTIDNKPYGVAPFADVVGHWAERPIGSEYQAGRIKGYPDGTFRPNAFITRAEAVVILNKIFERNYDAMSAMNAKNKEYIKRFIDLAPSFWGFNDMVEATNTHLFKRRVKGAVQEDWVEVK